MKKTMKTLLSVLLALTMICGLLPGMISMAHAATGGSGFCPSCGCAAIEPYQEQRSVQWQCRSCGAVFDTPALTGATRVTEGELYNLLDAIDQLRNEKQNDPAARDALKNAADSLYDTFARANYYINYDVQDAYYSAKSVYNRYASGGAAIEYEHIQVKAGAANVTAVYDGQPHGIAVSVSDPTENYTVTYGTEEGAYPLKVSPTLTNVTDEPLTVYYQVMAYGYDAFTGSATVTITKKAVTVAADAKDKVYGSADPELTATVTGAVEGDEINYTLTREAGENVGEYAITVTPGSKPNYDVTVTGSTLTVTKKAVTVAADAKEKVYGSDDPELTATVTGAVAGDEIEYTLSRAEGETVGKYAITVTPGQNPNYDVTVTGSTLTIGKKAVTVAADAKEKVYGSADPELTATVTGALDGDEIEYTLSREEGEDAGEYTITVTPGQNAKYDVTVIEGNLTITKKPVTIVAHDKSKNEGEADPALTAGVKGTVGSDKIKYELYRKKGEAAGTYAIIVSVKANDNPNYAITAVDAVFTVNAAAEAGVVTVTEEMLTVQEDGTVTVDLTAMEKEITEIVIPNAVLAKITDALEIKLAKETISFDAEAVAAIKEQAGDKDLHLELNGNEAEKVRAFIVDEAGVETNLELPAAKD